jgi:hypothetical protein
MRLLVTGSRDWDCDALAERILSGVKRYSPIPVVVVHGACHVGRGGVDGAFDRVAGKLGLILEPYPANRFGSWPGCGPVRNSHMVKLGADLGIACHPDLSKSGGTLDCVRKMINAGIHVVLHASEDDRGRIISASDLTKDSP